MKRYVLNENNSGGYWWLGWKEYGALASMGWTLKPGWGEMTFEGQSDPTLPFCGGDVPNGFRHYHFYLVAESLQEAKASFFDATGLDPDAEGCSCCGSPFYFEEESLDSPLTEE